MNLLDKLTHLISSGLALMLIPFFFACDDPTALGLELDSDENPLQGNKIEFTLPSSTIYIDSLRTDATTLSLFGQNEDSVFGKVTATSFAQYSYPLVTSATYPTPTSYKSASVSLFVNDLVASGIVSGDEVFIHESLDTIFTVPVYLSSRITAYDPQPVGSTTFDFDSATDTTILIPLDDTFGRSLYDRLIAAANDLTGADSLRSNLYFSPALVLVPGNNNKGLFTFDLSNTETKITVSMDTVGSSDTAYETNLTFNTLQHYSQIQRDRNGSKLSDLIDDYDESTAPSTNVYLSMIAGAYPKIDLTPFHEFIEGSEQLIINKATLSFSTDETNNETPYSDIASFFIKENGRIDPSSGSQFGRWFSTALMGDQFYYLNSAPTTPLLFPLSESEETYSNSVTLFAQTMSDYYQTTDEHLTTELAVFGNSPIDLKQTSFPQSDIKLTIFYTTIKN